MTLERVSDRSPLAQGQAALAAGAWEAAIAALDEAVVVDPADAAAWEALGCARGWLQQTDRAIDARQRAYALYREQGDDVSAARLSLDLANDYFEARGEAAVGNGWLQRARRLLEGRPASREHALLRIWDAYLALAEDPGAAEAHARDAAALARDAGAADTGVLALALQGLARVSEGRVPDGMRLLDEAVAGAIGGEFTDPQWFYLTCCCMIDACDRVRDYSRSLEWCHQLRAFSERWRVQAFLTTCRIKFTGALLWQGDWPACESELENAAAELAADRPSGVASAVVRMAELRRRQGRRAEAEELIQRAGTHPLAPAVRAALALDADDAATARDLADLSLRRTPPTARTERVVALELKVRAHARLGQLDEARDAAQELAELAGLVNTHSVRAAALMAAGVIAVAEAEHERAWQCFEDAAWLLAEAGSPPEAARARLDAAACLDALGRVDAAATEAAAALAVLERVGAAADARRARKLLERIAPDQGRGVEPPDRVLTPRQREVLALVAQGLSDRDIAERLVLSEHTVHRHVANIMSRLRVSSRTAAAVRALRDDLL